MKLRKANKYVVYSLLAIIVFTGIVLGVSDFAMAAAPPTFDPPPDYNPGSNPVAVLSGGKICAGYYEGDNFIQYHGLTARYALCIQHTIGWALQNYLNVFISYFITTINALMALAVAIYGFFVFTGRAQPAGRQAVILVIQIGVIVLLINAGEFINLFPLLINSIDWMVGLVTNYTAMGWSDHCPYSTFIWDRVDCVLNMLIGGILPGGSIAFGLAGFILAMLFAGGIGVAFFFFGLGVILSCLLSVIQAMFILLSAYIALALLSLLAPLVIPLILFKTTKAYFEKWLRMMIGVALQPIFLFAYLSLFLIAIEYSIFTGPYSVFRSIACDNVNNLAFHDVYMANPNSNNNVSHGFSVGKYVQQTGVIKETADASSLFSMVVAQNTKKSNATPTGAAPKDLGPQGLAAEKDTPPITLYNKDNISVDVRVDTVDIEAMAELCDMETGAYLIRLILSLFAAAAVLYIFYTMLSFIPYLGTLISSDLFGLPNLANILPMNSVSGGQLMDKLGFNKKGGFGVK